MHSCLEKRLARWKAQIKGPAQRGRTRDRRWWHLVMEQVPGQNKESPRAALFPSFSAAGFARPQLDFVSLRGWERFHAYTSRADPSSCDSVADFAGC